MRVLITRPEPDGERTAAQLRAKGCEVMLAPLLRIEFADADIGEGPWGALVLTSANAVRAAVQNPRLAGLRNRPVFAVGVRTASDARAAGFVDVISANGDQAALVNVVKARYRGGAPLLYLAGEDRTGDLAGDFAKAGIAVQTVTVYWAVAADAFPGDVCDALAAGRIDAVLHFSRRSAEAYLRCACGCGILRAALAPAHYCLSQAVAEPLRAAGATRIAVAQEPREAALIGLVTA
jgi:uroporphyrinogen-III synthase